MKLKEMPYITYDSTYGAEMIFDLELENFKDKKQVIDFIYDILAGKEFKDKYGEYINLENKNEKLEFIESLRQNYYFNTMLKNKFKISNMNKYFDNLINFVKDGKKMETVKIKLSKEQKRYFEDIDISQKISDKLDKIRDLKNKEPKDDIEKEQIDLKIRSLELDIDKLKDKEKEDRSKETQKESYMREAEMSLEEKIVNFFVENPYPDDKQVHAFAEKNNIDEHELEGKIYQLVSTFLCGGRAWDKKVTEKDVDPDTLKEGVLVEYEHLDKDSPYAEMLAKRISLDHIAESKDPKKSTYYIDLKKMEKEAGIED